MSLFKKLNYLNITEYTISCLKKYRLFIITFLLLLFSANSTYSREQNISPILTVDSKEHKYQLGPYLNIFEDKTNNLTINDIKDKVFTGNNDLIPNLGNTNSAIWLKFTIKSAKDDTWLLEIDNVRLDDIQLYIPDNRGEFFRKETGNLIPFNLRPEKYRNFLFELSLSKNTQTFYLKIRENGYAIQLPLILWDDKAFSHKVQTENLIFGAFIGIFLVMILYNLTIFFFLKDRSYLYYVTYLAVALSFFLTFFGLTTPYLWPNMGNIYANIFSFLAGCYLACMLIFSISFLETNKYLPKIRKYLIYLIILLFGLALTSLTMGFKYNQLFALLTLITQVIIIYLAIYTLIQGYKPARYFLLAWIVYIVFIIISALWSLNIIHSNFSVYYNLLIGSAIEITLLSIALADKFNLLKIKITETTLLLDIEKKHKNEIKIKSDQIKEKNFKLAEYIENLQKTREKLIHSEKMASLGILTAGISHEINNPINYISSSINGLKSIIADILSLVGKYEQITVENCRDKLTEIKEFKDQIDLNDLKEGITVLTDNIATGINRTSDIIKGLNTYSRTKEDIKVPFDVNNNIDITLKLFKEHVPGFLKINCQYGEIPLIKCYPGKINQVFMNLISNAIDSIKSKTELTDTEEIVIRTTKEGEKYVKVEITDTGIGIAENIITNIFEPFFTTKEVGKGTGLGLSITSGIIAVHDGTIKVQSESGQGATFTVLLPVGD